MIAIDEEVLIIIRRIATRAALGILIWMVAMVIVALHKRRRTKIDGER